MSDNKYDIYIVIPLGIIFTSIFLSIGAFPSTTGSVREEEVKDNCHEIQLAVERYFIDHDEYPRYLLGGDIDSWDPLSERGCEITKHPPLKGLASDPLLESGYLTSYPANPFVSRHGSQVLFWTGGLYKSGYGDPRFGFDGKLMGNCLNDPVNLWGTPEGRYRFDTLPNTIGTAGNMIDMIMMSTPGNPFYSMGGIPEWSRTSMGSSSSEGWINSFWPGQFFYRASGKPVTHMEALPKYNAIYGYEGKPDPKKKPGFPIWDFKPEVYDRYMIGGYGNSSTRGIDCIRLTKLDGTTANNISGTIGELYSVNPDFDWEVKLSTPEVFGGGAKGVLPRFPYYDQDGYWIYGAPDGYPDGIIILLTDDGELGEYEYTLND